MGSNVLNLIAADALLFTHLLFVVFVVFSLPLILAGKRFAWSWVRNPWFRWVHLFAIGVVVLQSWLGMICPLTRWEMALRARSGDAVYAGTFISHWLESILYYQAPAWAFIVAYTAFGLLVAFAWYRVPPRPFSSRKAQDDKDQV